MKQTPFPTKAQVLEFIKNSPNHVGKREIARAFHLKADDKPALKALLRELKDDGALQADRGRKFATPGTLPDVAVVLVTSCDSEGDLLAKPETWTSENVPPKIFMHEKVRGGADLGVGDRVLAKLQRHADGSYFGRTIRRLESAPPQVLGVYKEGRSGGRIIPTNKRDRTEYWVSEDDVGTAEPGSLVLANVLRGRRFGMRHAKITECIGSMDDPRAFSLIAIHSHDIPHVFPDVAITQAQAATGVTHTDGYRTDIRDIPLVTIDGEDARDFDDAVFARPSETIEDGWDVLVAIADVAYYVQPDDALDQVAYERGNSVYFPDRVVPMLPEELSNGWCSLRPDEDRPCMAVWMTFDRNGHKVEHHFFRALMRSAARLTYTQVQNALDGMPDETTAPLLDSVLQPLHRAYKALDHARLQRGTLDLDIPEKKVIVADGKVARVEVRARYDSHKLIEEFMIAANVCAAETLERADKACMFRVHDQPLDEKLDALRDGLKPLDINLAKGQTVRPIQLNGVLQQIKGRPEEHMVNMMVLRAQAQAVYSPENLGHFGLALRRYAHFTSPIRRYADLIVHRALISTLNAGPGGLPPHFGKTALDAMPLLEKIGEHISATERRAAQAEREATERYTTAYMADHIGAEFAGRVVGITRFGMFVALEESGAEGLVPISTLPDDYYIHDEIRHQLVGERTRKVFRLGDNVTIRIMEANTISGGLMLELAGQPARKHDIETSGGDLAGHMPLKRRSSQRRGGHPPGGKGRHSSHHRGQHNEDEGNRKPHAKSTAAKAKPKSKRRGKPTGKRGKPSFHKKG